MTFAKDLTEAHRNVIALAELDVWDEAAMATLRSAAATIRLRDRGARLIGDAPDSTSASRKRPNARMRAKSKPKSPELLASEAVVRERSGGDCEARTPWCQGRATQAHHIAGRSNNGPDDLLDVCGMGNVTGCHGWIHQNPEAAGDLGFMRSRLGQVRP